MSIRIQICQLVFLLPIKSNLAFFKVVGSENHRLALNGEKHLATVFI